MSDTTGTRVGGPPTSAEHTAETAATPAQVWAHYTDTGGWPRWNAAVEAVVLDGPFREGTTGTLTPPGAEPLPFRLVEVAPGRSYTSETDIADTVTLRSRSVLVPLPGGGTRITQHSELVGPAAPYFAAAFGPALTAGVPRTVTTLAAVAAGGAGPDRTP